MIKGIGTDIIEIERIAKSIETHGSRFLNKLFTQREQDYCLSFQGHPRHFAGRFAGKEAVVKALGTGIGKDAAWLEIEILNDSLGKPFIELSPRLNTFWGDPIIHLSISHSRDYATAVAVVEERKS